MGCSKLWPTNRPRQMQLSQERIQQIPTPNHPKLGSFDPVRAGLIIANDSELRIARRYSKQSGMRHLFISD
jgi:hypothetical protein